VSSADPSHRFVRHARTFASLTLVSRVLGLVRDALIVRLFGVTGLGSAFNIAFQFPNTFRRLFGEGALSAAFIPEYARLTEGDPERAHRFGSLTVALLGALLGAVVVVVELGIVATLSLFTIPPDGRTALVLLAIMLPFMPLVCITAVLGGMLQTRARFAAQAGAPIILNLCMIAAALLGAFALGLSPERTALLVAIGVTVAGLLQVAWCLRDLRGLAVWTRVFEGAGEPARRMFKRMLPVVVGLGAVQIATLIESWLIVAWPLNFGPTILGRPYPLDAGAGAALYNAQRLYQFPLGVFGIALATAAFPLLAKQAERRHEFADTLRRSVRLAAFIGFPATLGLLAVAHDAVTVIFLGGNVTPAGVSRMAACLVWYTPLIGAYSITHVLTRAFFATGDTRLPMRISVATVTAGLVLGAGLMWWMAERGLALAASIAAVAQLLALAHFAHRRLAEPGRFLFDRATTVSLAKAALAALVMFGVVLGVRALLPAPAEPSIASSGVRLAVLCVIGMVVYGALALGLLREETHWLRDRAAPASKDAR